MTPAGRKRVGSRTRDLVQSARAWQRTHAWPDDTDRFARDIAPGLRRLPTSALAEATGLSVAYCRRVQSGAVTPHPMWWGPLAELTE